MFELGYLLFSSLLKAIDFYQQYKKIQLLTLYVYYNCHIVYNPHSLIILYNQDVNMDLKQIVAILLLVFVQILGIVWSMNFVKITMDNPKVLLALSTLIFYCLCVDLARDELKSLTKFPITNATFLITFTACCLCKLSKQIKRCFSIVEVCAIIYYILHEQSNIRQILYYISQMKSTTAQFFQIIFILLSSAGIHVGCGILLKRLLSVTSELLGDDEKANQEYSSLVEDNNQNRNDVQLLSVDNEVQQQDKQILQIFVQRNNNLYVLIRNLLIFISVAVTYFSFAHQLKTQQIYNHTHLYLSKSKKIHFQDGSSVNLIQFFIEIFRIGCSAIIFHSSFGIWEKKFNQMKYSNDEKVWESFITAGGGLILAYFRLFAERL